LIDKLQIIERYNHGTKRCRVLLRMSALRPVIVVRSSVQKPATSARRDENHDVVRDDPIIRDKMLAYAFILTHHHETETPTIIILPKHGIGASEQASVGAGLGANVRLAAPLLKPLFEGNGPFESTHGLAEVGEAS
jgi:hypothetical protein